jgi:hypothetical protein
MKRWVLVAAALLALPVDQVRAQAVQNIVLRNSFNPVGAGARGLGMGGAFIAVADDGTASSFNPAGLAQLRRSELALVGFGHKLASTLTIPQFGGGAETRSSSERHNAPEFAGLSVPFDVGGRNLTIQLSYQRAVDLFGRGSAVVSDTVPFTDIGIDRPGAVDIVADVSPSQSGAFHTASLAAGCQVNARLSLGASVNYWIAEWSASGDTSVRFLTPLLPGARPIEILRVDRRFDQDQGLRGLNLNTGFMLRFARVSLGGVLRLPFTGDYSLEESGRRVQFELGQPSPPENTAMSMTSRLHWPRSAGVGIAVRPLRGLTLAADYARSHWSRTFIEAVPDGALLTTARFDEDGDRIESFTDRNFFDLLPASTTATADTDQWRAGAEYLIVSSRIVIPVRAGLFRDRSPVSELTNDEGRRIEGFTLGTGLNFNRIVLDVAFERRESDGVVGLRFRQGNAVPASASTESVREDRIVASLIYRFGGDGEDPLKKLLRYIFVGPRDEQGG